MKKTLIALAVAASAAVSSLPAIAANGGWGDAGGDFNLGGDIFVDLHKDVWEVYTGTSANFESAVESGTKEITLSVTKNIPVLGLRSIKVFNGGLGLTPQIKYGDDSNPVTDLTFSNSKIELTLTVKNKSNDQKIGALKTKMYAASLVSYKNPEGSSYTGNTASTIAPSAGDAFYGGLPSKSDEVGSGSTNNIVSLIPDLRDHFDYQGMGAVGPGARKFDDATKTFSAIYASGIMAGESTTITLDAPIAENTTWTAQLPITVSYQ